VLFKVPIFTKGFSMKLFSRNYLVLVVAMMFPVLGFAQAPGNLKIGVVNIQLVMAESPQVQDARAKLNDEFAPRERELSAMQTSLEARSQVLKNDLAVMGPDEREAAQREFSDEGRAFERAAAQFNEDQERRNAEVFRGVQQAVVAQVVAYGESEGFDLVLVEGIVFASDRVNITQAVLDHLKASEKAGQ